MISRPFAVATFCTLFAAEVAAQAPVTLTPSPATLTFTYMTGAALPAAQTLAVKASAGKPLYTVTISGINTLWLTATPDSGTMPASLTVRVNPTGMPIGTYFGTITVNALGASAPAAITVTLVVNAPLPTLSVTPSLLNFSSPPLQPAPQTVRLTTNGGPVSFTAAATGSTWLQVTPTTGVVLPGQQVTLTVTVDASAVVPQALPYVAKVTIVATGVAAANKTQNVTVNLLANASNPTITSIWPPSAEVNSPATTVTIRGTNFYAATLVKIAGVVTPLATTVLSPTVLMAVIPATALTTPGNLLMVASNPTPGGDSPPSAFTVLSVPSVQATVSVASNAGLSISPGELATLYGANIGPVLPASMNSTMTPGFVDTSLNGVSVTIDGVAAPLLYVSQNQISVQVPYAVTLGTGKIVSVVNGLTTATGTVAITATAPGIFTLDGSGTGQAAALNYNAQSSVYTLNQTAAPAKLGDIVVLYVTGEGDYATSVIPRTGLLVPPTLSPLPQVNPLPTVTIGGATATVQYAGPLIGSIMGLLQVNVVVPAGATTGTAVPVVVTIGGVPSQAGVTLSIHP